MAIFDKVKELIADLKGVNLFTFLRENKIYARLRERAMVLLNKKKEETVDKVEEYLRDKSPIAKAKLVNWIMANIELGFPFNLFKGKEIPNKCLFKCSTNHAEKNFDKLVQFLLLKLQEI